MRPNALRALRPARGIETPGKGLGVGSAHEPRRPSTGRPLTASGLPHGLPYAKACRNALESTVGNAKENSAPEFRTGGNAKENSAPEFRTGGNPPGKTPWRMPPTALRAPRRPACAKACGNAKALEGPEGPWRWPRVRHPWRAPQLLMYGPKKLL